MPDHTRSLFKRAAAFCYLWLMLGFFIGTVVLLGPVRWFTTWLRDGGFSQRTENLAIFGVILIFVATSALLAWWVVVWLSGRHARIRIAVPAALTIVAAVCLWGWMNPAHLFGAAPAEGSGRVDFAGGARFVFGPYPDRARLEQLRKDGYTAVISLQHPAVVPFEPLAISEETSAAKEVGLEFIHAPMLPWVSSNEESLNQIREIARSGAGKYYVHCGLGRDRANVVKRMLELEGTRVATADGYKAPQTLAQTPGLAFERGDIREVAKDLWLIPYPNEHEYFANLLSGQVRHVTLVLDSDDPTQRGWIEQGTRLLTQYAIPFDVRPLRSGGDPALARAIVESAERAPRPAAIVVAFTDPYPASTDVARILLKSIEATRSTSSHAALPPAGERASASSHRGTP